MQKEMLSHPLEGLIMSGGRRGAERGWERGRVAWGWQLRLELVFLGLA